MWRMILKLSSKLETDKPDLDKIRPVIFWDTNIHAIEWNRQYASVIRRVFERGNEHEKKEITRFYGKEKIDEVLNQQ